MQLRKIKEINRMSRLVLEYFWRVCRRLRIVHFYFNTARRKKNVRSDYTFFPRFVKITTSRWWFPVICGIVRWGLFFNNFAQKWTNHCTYESTICMHNLCAIFLIGERKENCSDLNRKPKIFLFRRNGFKVKITAHCNISCVFFSRFIARTVIYDDCE